MIDEICAYLHNYFDRENPKYYGEITISNGALVGFEDKLLANQYFRIVGSIFNDGVYKYPVTNLKDEVFTKGAVWALSLPPDFIALCKDISDWVTKYNAADSAALSPFNSESFGGYSYSKSTGGSASGNVSDIPGSWQSAFASRLARWKKL